MAMDVSPDPLTSGPFNHPGTSPSGRVNSGSWVKRLLLIGGALGIVAALGTVIPNMFAAPESGPHLMYTVARSDLTVTIMEQGTLEISDNLEIKNKVRGSNTVTWVIPSGSVVKAGDELVRLDTKVIEETVSEQKTKVFEATATLKETEADLAGAQINLDAYLDVRYRGRLKRS